MKRKVLIVDDEPVNRMILNCLLAKCDWIETSEACDGNEAIEAVKSDKPALIFMDFKMPGMNGGEAAKLIKESIDQDIYIVLVTAYHMQDLGEEYQKDMGYFDYYMNKPVDIDKLTQLVKDLKIETRLRS
jgi:CheY-like chemotaxis protein